MPEMKRTLQAGKMNRNNDPRVVRPGESREAMNVGIGRSDTSAVGSVENILGNVEITNSVTLTDTHEVIGLHRDSGNERIYYFVTNNENAFEENEGTHYVFEYDQKTNQIKTLVTGEFLNFHKNYLITGISFVDDLLFWTDDRNEPRKINVVRAVNNDEYYDNDFKISVAKFAPTSAPVITQIATDGNNSTFLEDKLVRFAYRYKYDDNEYSTISPLSPICFRSITDHTLTGDDLNSGEIRGFVNHAKRVLMQIQIPVNRGITAVEILYNESSSSNIYILEEILASTESGGNDPISVEYVYNSQDPFKTLPGDQLTRVYDAVPRKAKSQEFAGGRVIYGDYLQNYNIPSMSFDVQAVAKTEDDDGDDAFYRQSVKSRRTYQIGIILADKYGRQTPVILSSTGNDTIFVDPKQENDAMQKLQIQFNTDFPEWAESYRVVVKQRIQEYYNWFVPNATANTFPVTGTNVNKVPRDTTQETIVGSTGTISQSNRKVYPKLNSAGVNIVANDEEATSPLQISQIAYANNGLATATVYGTGLGTGNVVLETVPEESALDIFYETSTAAEVPANKVIEGYQDIQFYNCYILNIGTTGHLELNRIRAGFNEPWFTIGLKAYVVQDNFAEQRRFNTLIHSSGLFNSRTGINYVNQFNEAEGGITVSLDPADGSIQKLYAEDTALIIFQEDKVSQSPIDKDFIYSAEGGQVPVTSNTQFLGTISPYAGEYGISRNPESFAVYGTRKYFTDKNRGVCLRLSNNGLQEVSEYGLSDFFRDALAISTKVVGSFDEYHDQYNVTIVGNPAYGGQKDTNIATGKDGYFTISFEEEVNGWPSFKSYQQEGGTTLNNRYYTFNKGKLWEHNHRNAVYNNFYGTQHESYVEVILNDAPSDVKEWKTVNYEGTSGWQCESVETEVEQLFLDPEANELDTLRNITLSVTESVDNGRTSGLDARQVVDGETYEFVIRVDVDNPAFSFENNSVTATFDGTNLIGFSNGSTIFFRSGEQTASADTEHVVVIDGAAVQDISGAILTINLIDNIQDGEVTVFIPQTGPYASSFRAGATSFAYQAEADNPDVEVGVTLVDPDGDYELAPVANFTFSDSISALQEGALEKIENQEEVFFRQKITLPQVQVSGSVSINTNNNDDIVRLKPVVTQYTSTEAGDTDNYTIWRINNGTLEEFTEQFEAGKYFSGTEVTLPPVFIVPNFTDGTPDTGFVFLDGDVAIDLTAEFASVEVSRVERNEALGYPARITYDEDNLPIRDELFLLGAFKVVGKTPALSMGTTKEDTSQNVSVQWRVTATTTELEGFDIEVKNQDDTVVSNPFSGISIDRTVDGNFTIENTDFRNIYYVVTNTDGELDENTDQITIGSLGAGNLVNNLAGDPLVKDAMHNINIGTAENGSYRLLLYPNTNSSKYRGDNFTVRTIPITITGDAEN